MGCLSSKAGRHAKETKEKDGNDARVEVATPASPKKKGEKAAVAAKDVEVHVEGAAAPGKGGEAREDDFDPELLSEVENAVAKVMERKTAATSTGGSAPTAASAPAPARTARVPSPTKALNLALTFGEGVSVVPTKDPAHAALELDAATRRKSSTGVAADVAWSDGLVLYSTSCASTAELRNNIQRMKQLLETKRVPFEEVYLDIEPHRREDMLALTDGDRKLPKLVNTAKGICVASNHDEMQEMEDFGELDDFLR